MFGWTHDDIRDCFVALVISMGVGLIGALIMVSQVSNTSIKELIPLDLPSQRVRVSWQGSISDSKTQVFGPSEETKRQLDIVLDLVADAGSKGVLYEGRVDSLTIYNPDGLLFFRFSRPASYEYAYQFGPQVSDADRLACLKACCVDLEDSHSLNDSSIFSEPIQVYVTHHGVVRDFKLPSKMRDVLEGLFQDSPVTALLDSIKRGRFCTPAVAVRDRSAWSQEAFLAEPLRLEFRRKEEGRMQAKVQADAGAPETLCLSYSDVDGPGKGLEIAYQIERSCHVNSKPTRQRWEATGRFTAESIEGGVIRDAPQGIAR